MSWGVIRFAFGTRMAPDGAKPPKRLYGKDHGLDLVLRNASTPVPICPPHFAKPEADFPK